MDDGRVALGRSEGAGQVSGTNVGQHGEVMAEIDAFRREMAEIASFADDPDDRARFLRLALGDGLSVEQYLAILTVNPFERGLSSEEMLEVASSSLAPTRRGKGKATLALEAAILNVLAGFDGPMSSRQVYYQVVSSGAVANNKKECGRVLRTLVDLRREGRVPYDRIVDRTRRRHLRPSWDGVEEILESCATHYRRNVWTDQRVVPMVCCEKAALEGIFSQAVDELGASLWTVRGYVSESFAWDWAEEILDLNRAGKSVQIFYFGDHDPSGLGIEADARKKLEGFGAQFEWARSGLLAEDFDAFDLVNVDVKASDSRAKVYLSRFGNRAAELDALPPAVLHERIRAAIESCVDGQALERVRVVEEAERETLRLVVSNWPVASAAARGAA